MAQCSYCQRPFKRRHITQVFCSAPCRSESRNLDRRRRRDLARFDTSHEQFIAALEDRSERTCAHCGGRLNWMRSTRRYCSDKCRQRASRLRRRGLSPTDRDTRVVVAGFLRLFTKQGRTDCSAEAICDAIGMPEAYSLAAITEALATLKDAAP